MGFQDQLLVHMGVQAVLGLLGLAPSVLLQHVTTIADLKQQNQHVAVFEKANLAQWLLAFRTEDTALQAALRLQQVVPDCDTGGRPPPDDGLGREDVLGTTPEALLAQCLGLTILKSSTLESSVLFGGVACFVQEFPLLTMFPAVLLAWCLGQGGHFMWLLDYENRTQRPGMRDAVVKFFQQALGPAPVPESEPEPKLEVKRGVP